MIEAMKIIKKRVIHFDLRRVALMATLALSLTCCGNGAAAEKGMNPAILSLLLDASGRTVVYRENGAVNVLNPDRGFYDADYELDVSRDYNAFMYAKEAGYTLVYAPLHLELYAETATLPENLLATMEQNLNDAEASGVKLILRVVYRSGAGGSDATLDIISAHFAQLGALLDAHKEIISVVQAGTIGAWGEWHSFSGDFAETNSNYIANRRAVITMLSNIFPEKYLQIRTPMHKELLFGSSVHYADESSEGCITEAIAFGDDIRAKIGHHNDCFLADSTDMGTYPSDNIAFWKDYVINDARYAPVGGETCGIGEGDEALLSSCTNAVAELKKMHYSYLNHAYHPDVLQKWKDEGCYSEIRENLGYRLVARQLTINKSSDTLSLKLEIENKGYAAPYIDSSVVWILKSALHTYTFEQHTDMRTFYPGEIREISADLPLEGIARESYTLALQIGENASVIRLSNEQLWDENSSSNTLEYNIAIE